MRPSRRRQAANETEKQIEREEGRGTKLVQHPHNNLLFSVPFFFSVRSTFLGFVFVVIKQAKHRPGLAAGIPSFLMCSLIKNQVQAVGQEVRGRCPDTVADTYVDTF